MPLMVLDIDRCTGHGRCYAVAPDLFEDDEDGRVIQLVSKVTGWLDERAREAIAACPENALWCDDSEAAR